MRKFLAALLLCLAACSQKGWMDKLASPDEQHLAITTAEQFRAGEIDKIAEKSAASLKGDLPKGVAVVRPILARTQGPFEIETVNVSESNRGPVRKTLTLQTGSGSNWAVIELVFDRIDGSMQLVGCHALPASSDPSKLNDFRLSQRGVLGYLWLFAMVICISICVTAVALVWRSPWLKRRWLWTLGSLIGFGSFALNWSTGAWGIKILNVSLLGASGTRSSPYAPWIFTFAIPVVAVAVIVRWLRRERFEERGV
jgi:hypothetical protein